MKHVVGLGITPWVIWLSLFIIWEFCNVYFYGLYRITWRFSFGSIKISGNEVLKKENRDIPILAFLLSTYYLWCFQFFTLHCFHELAFVFICNRFHMRKIPMAYRVKSVHLDEVKMHFISLFQFHNKQLKVKVMQS